MIRYIGSIIKKKKVAACDWSIFLSLCTISEVYFDGSFMHVIMHILKKIKQNSIRLLGFVA